MNQEAITIDVRTMLCVAAESCNIAWVFMLFLTGTFFGEIGNVAMGPLFSLCGCLTALISFCLARDTLYGADVDVLDRCAAALFLASGLVLLCSRMGHGAVFFLLAAALPSGIGVLAVVFGGFRRFVLFGPSGGVSFVVGSLAGGIGLLAISQAVTPPEVMAGWGVVLPLVSILLTVVVRRLPPCASQLDARRNQYSDMFEKRSFAGFAFASGFLLSFCYNAFPKSFRFIGSYGHPLFGYVGEADAFLLVSTLVMAGLVVLISRAGRRNTALAPVVIVGVIAFSFGLAFSLSFLGQTWIPAALLLGIAVLACGACVAGYISLSVYPRITDRGVRIIVWLLAGLVLGSALAFAYIARTVSLAGFSSIPFEDMVLFDGTALVGFAAMVVTAFLSFWYSKIPDRRLAVVSGSEPLDVVQRCSLLSEKCELSPREKEILVFLAQGRSGPYIQEELCIAKSTVKTHVRHIYEKVGVTSRQELLDTLQRMG